MPAGVEPPTLEIADDGTVTLFAGCNRGGGTVVITDTTMTFEPLVLTMMACEGEAGTVEATVVAVLDGSVDVAIEGDTLTITNGDRGLVYTGHLTSARPERPATARGGRRSCRGPRSRPCGRGGWPPHGSGGS